MQKSKKINPSTKKQKKTNSFNALHLTIIENYHDHQTSPDLETRKLARKKVLGRSLSIEKKPHHKNILNAFGLT